MVVVVAVEAEEAVVVPLLHHPVAEDAAVVAAAEADMEAVEAVDRSLSTAEAEAVAADTEVAEVGEPSKIQIVFWQVVEAFAVAVVEVAASEIVGLPEAKAEYDTQLAYSLHSNTSPPTTYNLVLLTLDL